MGRAAVHTGKIITWDEMMASKYRACSHVAALTNDSPAPVRADARAAIRAHPRRVYGNLKTAAPS